jgi:hypothetical protein
LFDVVLEESGDGMAEEIVPFDAIVGIDYQHFAKDVLDVRIYLLGEC